MFPPKTFLHHFVPSRGCSEGLDAFRFFFKRIGGGFPPLLRWEILRRYIIMETIKSKAFVLGEFYFDYVPFSFVYHQPHMTDVWVFFIAGP